MNLKEAAELKPRKIAVDVDYEPVILDSLRDILNFSVGKTIEKELTLEDFGQFSRRKYEGADETSIVQFTDGSILIAQLYPEYHYSENTMESAYIYYAGLTPKESK